MKIKLFLILLRGIVSSLNMQFRYIGITYRPNYILLQFIIEETRVNFVALCVISKCHKCDVVAVHLYLKLLLKKSTSESSHTISRIYDFTDGAVYYEMFELRETQIRVR